MRLNLLLSTILFLCLCCSLANAQDTNHPNADQQSPFNAAADLPSRWLTDINNKTANLDKLLARQTKKYMDKLARREAALHKRLYRIDSSAAKRMFDPTGSQYVTYSRQLSTDSTLRKANFGGGYQPNADTIQTGLAFLQRNPALLSTNGKPLDPAMETQLQRSISELNVLQAKLQDADQIKLYLQERRQQIGDYISRYANYSPGLMQEFQGMKQDMYYYQQQVNEYKEALNDPDKLTKKAIAILDKLPAFQQFMQSNSQLAALFPSSANTGTPAALIGLQTRDQMQQMIQGQVAFGGANALGSLQNSFGEAQQEMNQLRSKLSGLGTSGGNSADVPDFKPNGEKTHSFLKRLEFGTNLQTTHNTLYYPILTDLGLSVGYKINNSSTAGVGASMKIGWGSGIRHIAVTCNGVGIRSFLDIKLKGSISATGGLEYNYTEPVSAFHDIDRLRAWTPSGLIGITKTISVRSRAFKKTKVQLLWDFLSYQQIPNGTPILFRVGYSF